MVKFYAGFKKKNNSFLTRQFNSLYEDADVFFVKYVEWLSLGKPGSNG